MDDMDRAILGHLAADARLSLAVLARRLKVARSTVQARLERLEGNGTIAGYTVKLGGAARDHAAEPRRLRRADRLARLHRQQAGRPAEHMAEQQPCLTPRLLDAGGAQGGPGLAEQRPDRVRHVPSASSAA